MGNSQSRTPDSGAPSASNQTSESKTPPSARRDQPRNLIHSQRTAAAAEQSQIQARGTTTPITATHRSRHSQSAPVARSTTNPPASSTSPLSNESRFGAQHLNEQVDPRDQPSKPVDVPLPSTTLDTASSRSYSLSHSIDHSVAITAQDMSYNLQRPPRVPLPIEQEVHEPGSPIIAPADNRSNVAPAIDIETTEIDPTDLTALPRGISQLSNTTVDDDDAEELNIDRTAGVVPTTFEWRRGGKKVYVTGTPFQWNRKQKLHAVPGQPGHFKTVINLHPGTHHIRFMVDNVMTTSPDMPTTVDFGNNLVNYIDVDPPGSSGEASTLPSFGQPSGIPEPDMKAAKEEKAAAKPPAKTKVAVSPSLYYSQIPQYLIDLDKPEESRAYQAAAAAINNLPSPPSLPQFFAKPVLNVAAAIKDDNSVLTMPNHTVLNHLATSSIKNNTLAVSGTTRYKRKYVTTIMYKPSGDDDS